MTIFDTPIPIPGAEPLCVTAHDGASYVLSDGRTLWATAPLATALPEDIALEVAALLAAPPSPPAAPRRQPARVVLARLTAAEKAALRACTVPAILDAYDVALIEGTISEADPDFPAFRDGLAALGIISASRWTSLLAP